MMRRFKSSGPQGNAFWVVTWSFILALVLTIVPLPEWAEPFRPEWVTLILIYWCIAIPGRVGVGVGWFSGLLLDVLKGTLLGQYALSLAVVAFVSLKIYRRVRNFPVGQQALMVLILLLLQQTLTLWVRSIIGESPETWMYWMPAFTGMLLWPWVFFILRDVRRRHKIS